MDVHRRADLESRLTSTEIVDVSVVDAVSEASPASSSGYRPARAVARVMLNRPRRLNAMSWEMITDLRRVFRQLSVDDVLAKEVRVVVLCSEGTYCPAVQTMAKLRHCACAAVVAASDVSRLWSVCVAPGKGFCVGADFKASMMGSGGRAWDATKPECQAHFSGLISDVRNAPQPVVAAVQGPAYGGGMCLALAADVRIASADAAFRAAFLTLGLSGCEMGSSFFLPRLVGESVARDMMMTGRVLRATEAKTLGLVSVVVPLQELHGAAMAKAAAMVNNSSPLGLRLTKRHLNQQSDGMALHAALSGEDLNQLKCLNDEECNLHAADYTSRVLGSASRRPATSAAAACVPETSPRDMQDAGESTESRSTIDHLPKSRL